MQKTFTFIAIACVLISSPAAAQPYSDSTEITILTSDSVTVYGDIYDHDEDRPLILLFHQGGGNGRAEYGPIIPRLIDEGFSALAIDQRRGGDRLGGVNRTMEAMDFEAGSYCEVVPDLEAALDFALDRFQERTVVLWGSSYTAALAIRLAAARGGDIAGVLAFSPASGEPMEGCRPEEAAASLTIPLMIFRPARELEHDWIREQFETFSGQGHRTYVAQMGAHASSMLNSERTGADVEANWDAVLSFLHSLNDS